MSPMDQNLSQLRIVICTIFSYYYSMAIEASIPSAWCQQCWFWLLKSYAFTTVFTILVFLFVTSFTLSPLLSFYLTIWFPLGWFLLWVKGNMRSSSWCFIFHSLHVFYILSFFLNYFFCIFMTCLKSLYIFCSVAYKWSFVCTTVLYSTFLRKNKVFLGKINNANTGKIMHFNAI